jgi:hypothetical protein
VVGGLLSWMEGRRTALAALDERMVERYLRHRAGRQTISRATGPRSSDGCRCCVRKA